MSGPSGARRAGAAYGAAEGYSALVSLAHPKPRPRGPEGLGTKGPWERSPARRNWGSGVLQRVQGAALKLHPPQ